MSDQDPHAAMMAAIFHHRIHAQMLRTVAGLSLADHLAAGPRTSGDIAAMTGLDEPAAQRLLRYCVANGLVILQPDACYAGTPSLATLRSDDPLSLRAFALAQNGAGQWTLLGRLDEAFRTGRPQAEAALGCGLYDYYAQPEHAEEAAHYRQGLSGLTKLVEAELKPLIDPGTATSVLDVGGSTGSLVLMLLDAHPHLHGSVLDLDGIEESALSLARSRGLENRFEFIPGDMFVTVPASDLYVLKYVLGNWPDDACLTVLHHCRRSASTGSRLLVIETMMDDTAPSQWAADIDVITLVAVGGMSRTMADYTRLLETVGFSVRSSHQTSSFSLIEAEAV